MVHFALCPHGSVLEKLNTAKGIVYIGLTLFLIAMFNSPSLQPPNQAGIRILKIVLKALSFLLIGILMILALTAVSVNGEASVQTACAIIMLSPLSYIGGKLAIHWNGSIKSWFFIMILPTFPIPLIGLHYMITSPSHLFLTELYYYLIIMFFVTLAFYFGSRSSIEK